MKRTLLLFLFVCISAGLSYAQTDTTIIRHLKSWTLSQDGAQTDSISMDTAFYRINNFNPVLKKYPHALFLTNKGSAYRSNSLVDQGYNSDFLFITNLDLYFRNPDNIEFYNTTTPYTNLQYYNSPPKKRSEETLNVLHTQNITKNWNVGINYHLSSSIGRYDASQADFRNFRFFTSYQSEKYSIHAAFIYNKSFNFENGGLANDSVIIKNENPNLLPENIVVNLRTSQTKIENYRAYITQSMGIGAPKFFGNDSTTQLPLATVSYTLDYNYYTRAYTIDKDDPKHLYYKSFYIDSIATRDSTKFTELKNIVQFKINEEANKLFKFGLRAYIGNEIELITMTAPSVYKTSGINTTQRFDQHSDTTLISNLVGGQIFKNNGENFWWNAGAKIYFQGYKAGEFLVNGKLDSRFPLWGKQVAGLFANGSLEFSKPNYFQNKFYSNHFKWDNNFKNQKIIRLNGGVKVPTSGLELTGHINFLYDYIYWNSLSMPTQYGQGQVLQTYGATLTKHFQLWKLHSIDNAIIQYSSNQDVIALPLYSIYSSNYIQFTFSKVLDIQLGFDFRYNSAYFSPAYNPAIGMFITQNSRKTGNFPDFTPFLNAHIKRFNFFIEYEHSNQGHPSYDAFYTVGYPYNPANIKFGVMWNFYD